MLRTLAFAVALGLATASAAEPSAQPLQGQVLRRLYSTYELGVPQTHLGIGVSAAGHVASGTMDGVVVFDGHHWSHVDIPNQIAREVEGGADGRIYVGGVNTVGVLTRGPNGDWIYDDLLDEMGIDRTLTSIGSVTRLEATPEGVYATAQSQVLRLPGGACRHAPGRSQRA